MYTTADLIATIESNYNLRAMRFEPELFARYRAIYTESKRIVVAAGYAKEINRCSLMTGFQIAATSYGKFQLMGSNIYGPQLGYKKDVISFMCDESAQNDLFDRFLKVRSIDFSIDELASSESMRIKFARMYNGSESYITRMEDEMRKHWVLSDG